MATQRITIAKIGGDAATVTRRLFQQWAKSRSVNDPNDWDSEQWSKPVRRRADAWAQKLGEHAHEPPVLFFVEYVDMWSFCPPARFLDQHGLIQVMADRYELFCLALPLESGVVAKLKKLRRKSQWDEDRLFGELTLAAATSWDGIERGGVLVFLRQVIGTSKGDEEIVNSLKSTPAWMRKGFAPSRGRISPQ